jgi:hypothetical protein
MLKEHKRGRHHISTKIKNINFINNWKKHR